MNWLRLALANLLLSPLTTAVSILLMTLGTASIVLLLLAGDRFAGTLARDARGIDLVLGAPGSPAQLILSAVYHADVPPGNVLQADAERWAEDSRVALAAPLALGDSFRGLRIVGTSHSYLELMSLSLAEGETWQRPMHAVLGAAAARTSGLAIGSSFSGAHGLEGGGHLHDEQAYRVVGILAPTGTVADRLILTSLESVWALHGHEAEAAAAHGEPGPEGAHADEHVHGGEHDEEAAHDDEGEHEDGHGHADGHGDDLEITAMLLRYRTPLAATTLPREINAGGALQAAAPAVEIARLLQLVGFGMDGLRAFAWVLIVTACLSVFAALYGSLRSRRGDLAMLRCLGATRSEVFLAMLSEGMLMSAAGIALGFALGHGAVTMLGAWLEGSRGVSLQGVPWAPGESGLLVVLLAVSVLSAAIPALQAYRTDVARTLAEGGS